MQYWSDYTIALTESNIRILEGEDEIIWAPAKHGRYSPKGGYLVLMDSHRPQICDTWWSSMWKLKVPPRSRLLMWTIMKNKIPIWEKLIKISLHGPFWCFLCMNNSDDIDHLFLTCLATKELWVTIHSNFPSLIQWQGTIVKEAWVSWWSTTSSPKARNISILTCWAIYISHNRYIFQFSGPH